jgi:hypothetical protein
MKTSTTSRVEQDMAILPASEIATAIQSGSFAIILAVALFYISIRPMLRKAVDQLLELHHQLIITQRLIPHILDKLDGIEARESEASKHLEELKNIMRAHANYIRHPDKE